MIFEQRLELKGKHAPLSPSKCSWLNYTDEKLIDVYKNSMATEIGTILHSYAADRITFKAKMNKNEKQGVRLELLRNKIPDSLINVDLYYDNLMLYVNDAIGFGLTPEVILYYSDYVFGTTDAIKYDEKKKFLRIHDYKSGYSKVHMEQLEIYAALFILQYGKKLGFTVNDISMELRIYQTPEVIVLSSDDNAVDLKRDIYDIMNKIVHNSLVLEDFGGNKRK
jgi:hypothetical protein